MDRAFVQRGARYVQRISRKLWGRSRLDTRGFHEKPLGNGVSREAALAAGSIRGRGYGPAVFIHGVLPRSGTVYVGEILRLHPALHAYPNDLWEIPFLELSGDIMDVQKHFFKAYPQNRERMGEQDFLPLFGASLMAYLHSFCPDGKRLLLKIPDVQYLEFFPVVFPEEKLLLLMRDGRDVVSSTVRTWPDVDFAWVCRKWALSARAMLDFSEKGAGEPWMVKYEDVIRDPAGFARQACRHFSLDQEAFPFGEINKLSVRGSSSIKSSGKVTWDASAKPEGFNPVGRWQAWNSKEKALFKSIAGEALIDAGYSKDMDW